MTTPDNSPPVTSNTSPRSLGASQKNPRFWSAFQFFIALAVTLGVIGWLLFAPNDPEPAPPAKRITLQDSVKVVGPRLITIAADCPLAKKLESEIAGKTTLTEPLFSVTGRVVASLRPAQGKASDYWQFDAPENLTVFTDLQKARADIAFYKNQLASTEELASTRVRAQENVVAQLEKLVVAGTSSPKDLAAEQTTLMQYKLQGKKEVHEAESALRIATGNEAALSRQLQQAGLDPELLRSLKSDSDIVMADVPESRATQVKLGVGCEARFFGIPDQVFEGKVNRVSPTLSKDRHSLRVLFVIHDPKDQIRPGMFADIGLGTDARQTIMVSTDAILHIGRSDFVLVHEERSNWRVEEVKVGELHGDRVEIMGSQLDGKRILTKGAILLKPPTVLSLQPSLLAKGK
jgi:cobalt-zinc-cadmium efflux system membrane fusion protein